MQNENAARKRDLNRFTLQDLQAQRTRPRRAASLLQESADCAENATDLLDLNGWDVRELRALILALRVKAEQVGRRA